MGDLEVSEGSGAFGVNNPFRDPLSVEVSHLVQEDVVLKTYLNSDTEDGRVGEVVCSGDTLLKDATDSNRAIFDSFHARTYCSMSFH